MTDLRRKVLNRVAQLMARWDRTGHSTVVVEVPEPARLEHIEGLVRALRASVDAQDWPASRQVLLLALAGQSVLWLESLEDDEQAAVAARLVDVMASA